MTLGAIQERFSNEILFAKDPAETGLVYLKWVDSTDMVHIPRVMAKLYGIYVDFIQSLKGINPFELDARLEHLLDYLNTHQEHQEFILSLSQAQYIACYDYCDAVEVVSEQGIAVEPFDARNFLRMSLADLHAAKMYQEQSTTETPA